MVVEILKSVFEALTLQFDSKLLKFINHINIFSIQIIFFKYNNA